MRSSFASDASRSVAGDFSGGLVDVATKSFPDRFTLQLSGSVTYDDLSTGRDDFLSYQGGSNDWLGMDASDRDLPDVVAEKDPTTELPTESDLRDVRVSNELRAARADSVNAFARAFNDVLSPSIESTPINYSLSGAVGGSNPESASTGGSGERQSGGMPGSSSAPWSFGPSCGNFAGR